MKRLVHIGFILAVVMAAIVISIRTHAQVVDYRHFSHTTAQHKNLNCDECHQRRETMSATPQFPSHSACIKCHVTQFTAQPLVICANCHQNVSSVKAPVQPFPSRNSFDASFDSKQHQDHMSVHSPSRPRKDSVHYMPIR